LAARSEKNRAENVMIVDMLRNDLGRVAEVGSVRAPRLFDVERYPPVADDLHRRSGYGGLQRGPDGALFPCASITGAPKTRTTQIIAELSLSRAGSTRAASASCAGPASAVQRGIRTVLVDREHQQAEYGSGAASCGIQTPPTSTTSAAPRHAC